MGIFIIVVGGIIGVIGLFNGASVSPNGAPQQAVQELRFVVAALGLVTAAIGAMVYQLELHRKVVVPPVSVVPKGLPGQPLASGPVRRNERPVAPTSDLSKIEQWRLSKEELLTPEAIQVVKHAQEAGYQVLYYPNFCVDIRRGDEATMCTATRDILVFGAAMGGIASLRS